MKQRPHEKESRPEAQHPERTPAVSSQLEGSGLDLLGSMNQGSAIQRLPGLIPGQMRQLQRTIGNQGVNRWIDRQSRPGEVREAPAVHSITAPQIQRVFDDKGGKVQNRMQLVFDKVLRDKRYDWGTTAKRDRKEQVKTWVAEVCAVYQKKETKDEEAGWKELKTKLKGLLVSQGSVRGLDEKIDKLRTKYADAEQVLESDTIPEYTGIKSTLSEGKDSGENKEQEESVDWGSVTAEQISEKVQQSYPELQKVTEEALSELLLTSGLLEKKEEGIQSSVQGQSLANSLVKQSGKQRQFKLPEFLYAMNQFRPVTSSVGINYQLRENERGVKMNVQQGYPPRGAKLVGLGTYSDHVGNLGSALAGTGIDPSTAFRAANTLDDRETRIENLVTLLRDAEELEEGDLRSKAEEVVALIDDTKGLGELEVARNYQDAIPTYCAFEGAGFVWPVKEALTTRNPMMPEGATEVISNQLKGEKFDEGLRKRVAETGKGTVQEIIQVAAKRRKNPGSIPPHIAPLVMKTWKFCKQPQDGGLRKQLKGEIQKMYSTGSKKRKLEEITKPEEEVQQPVEETGKKSEEPELKKLKPTELEEQKPKHGNVRAEGKKSTKSPAKTGKKTTSK